VAETPSSGERLSYAVAMTLPPAAREVSRELDETLHRANRYIGVITGGHERRLGLTILTTAADADVAQGDARRMLSAALAELGLAELGEEIEVIEVRGRPVLPGGPHRVDAAPELEYRAATLPDGRVLRAARAGPLGEWFAYTEDESDHVMAGRWLLAVIDELLQLRWGKKDQWVYDAIEELAGARTPMGIRYPCPCCDCLTLTEGPTGTFAICEVCGWEDDNVQFQDPDYAGGANRVSLREARDTYRRHGASELRRLERVRSPLPDEQP